MSISLGNSNETFQGTPKGVADEELSKAENERARKREREERDDELIESTAKRHRSVSSHSVSTISTGASRSPSPGKGRAKSPLHAQRGRSPSSDNSRAGGRDDSRSQSRSVSSNRSRSPRVETRRRRSLSGDSRSPVDDGRRDQYRARDPLPPSNGDETLGQPKGPSSEFRDPDGPQRQRYADSRSPEPRGRRDRQARERPQGNFNHQTHGRGGPPPEDQPRERSLSPFSQRLAMTKAMKQGGR
ncbi:zinc knuckle-domain-containing protein [Fusarium acuminatum]|uniref:Zinc knuckle-domain-containing protein n=1 Tax=Fusarium acuminatum TaxID=5515 RepID=A0ABZ2WUW1_9HYPO